MSAPPCTRSVRKDGSHRMHRVTEESWLTKSEWKHGAKDKESLRSTARGRHITLTECAFSWKFAGRRKDVLFGRRTLILFLLHRVVDRLSDDLAVLDQVGVSPISYPD